MFQVLRANGTTSLPRTLRACSTTVQRCDTCLGDTLTTHTPRHRAVSMTQPTAFLTLVTREAFHSHRRGGCAHSCSEWCCPMIEVKGIRSSHRLFAQQSRLVVGMRCRWFTTVSCVEDTADCRLSAVSLRFLVVSPSAVIVAKVCVLFHQCVHAREQDHGK